MKRPRHAAGVIDFVELKSQSAERMAKVFKPKAGEVEEDDAESR